MKLIQTSQEGLLFQFADREKDMLRELLKLYPRVPSAHQVVSKSGLLPDQITTQRLLDEALAEQRAENKHRVQTLLADAHRWTKQNNEWLLRLSHTEFEWLLQVLNDIRVGSWVLLGSPEESFEKVTPETAPHLLAMQLAGIFQMSFLHALTGQTDSPPI